MEAFKGKVRMMAESVSDIRQGKLRRRAGKVSLRMEKNFDRNGNLLEERFRKRKHINRITYKYNSKGNCVERLEFNFDHLLFFRYKFKYDRWGHQIEEQCFTPDGTLTQSRRRRYNSKGEELEHRIRKGASVESMAYTYDANGNLLSERMTRNGEFAIQRDYAYDSHGNKTADLYLSPEKEQTGMLWENQYDAYGNMISQILRDNKTQAVKAAYNFEYDSDNHRICTKFQSQDGEFSILRSFYNERGLLSGKRWSNKTIYNTEALLSCGENRFSYDSQGRLVEESAFTGKLVAHPEELIETREGMTLQTRYSNSELIPSYRTRYTYANGEQPTNIVEEQYGPEGKALQSTEKRFDIEGNLLENIHTDYDGDKKNITAESYKYDCRGNWIHCQHTENGITTEVVERHFEYWDDEQTDKPRLTHPQAFRRRRILVRIKDN